MELDQFFASLEANPPSGDEAMQDRISQVANMDDRAIARDFAGEFMASLGATATVLSTGI